MKTLIKCLDCGRYTAPSGYNHGEFLVTKFSDIETKIIPFFNKYRIKGVKALDFVDFCKTAEILKIKDHLTEQGLEEIRQIKAGMNSGRSY
jgi:hypothetical protein